MEDYKKHTANIVRPEKMVYYNEVTVDDCADAVRDKYTATIVTYVIEWRFLFWKFKQIRQSVPYVSSDTYLAYEKEVKTNKRLREVARKEYYKAMISQASENVKAQVRDNLNMIDKNNNTDLSVQTSYLS